AIDVADHHHRAARELEPARDQVRGPIRIVEPDEVVVASHDDVGTAVAVDVADVDAFGDLPKDALVDVMADEPQRGGSRRPDGSRREGGADHCGAKERNPPEPRGAGARLPPRALPALGGA